MSKEIILKVENLQMYFPYNSGLLSSNKQFVKAVDGVSFEIEKGKTFGLVGESGCGKTTTGKCILKVIKNTGGKIYFHGEEISQMSDKEFRKFRRKVQLIFQDPYGSLDPRKSVGGIIREALKWDGKHHTKAELDSRVAELLSLVELDPRMADRYPHELSGGQRQRLGIARALACDPELIVCDEPVSALDVSIQAQIINLFKSLQEKLGLTYLFIAHDLAVVQHIADEIGVMYLGHLVEKMPASELFVNSKHPYTKALLSAVPITDYDLEKSRTREILQGEVPSPINTPSGCPFNPRCSKACDKCRIECPQLKERSKKHLVSCHCV